MLKVRSDCFHRRAKALNLLLFISIILAGCNKDNPAQSQNTGDVQMDPPPAGQGLQIVVGPFDVAAGTEITRNYYMKLPSNDSIYITRVQMVYNVGSHHCNVFKSDTTDVVDHVEETFNAVQWESWDMIFNSQRAALDWQLPSGVAIPLKAHAQLDVQTHYVNAATQQTPNGHGKVIINIWTMPKDSVQSYLGMLFANNRTIKIPPMSDTTFMKMVRLIPWDVHILQLTGHFHSRGRSFVVKRYLSNEEIYRSSDWDEPPVLFCNPPLLLNANEQLAYWTRYYNATSDTLKFGPHVETQEHSNLFMYFYPGPADGKAIYDF